MKKENENNYYKIFTIPNLITTFRMVASVGLCAYIAMHGIANHLLITLATMGVGATDAIDGFLSRKCGMSSQLGGILDPIADKIYNWGIGITLMATGIMPLWPLIIAARDVAVFTVSSYNFKKNGIEMKPTIPAKLKMLFQSVGVISTLAFGFGTKGLSLIAPLSMGAAISTIGPEIYCIKKKFFNKKGINTKEEEKEKLICDSMDQECQDEKNLVLEYTNTRDDTYQKNDTNEIDFNIEKPKVMKKTIYHK